MRHSGEQGGQADRVHDLPRVALQGGPVGDDNLRGAAPAEGFGYDGAIASSFSAVPIGQRLSTLVPPESVPLWPW